MTFAITAIIVLAGIILFYIWNWSMQKKLDEQHQEFNRDGKRLWEAERIANLVSWEFDLNSRVFTGSMNAYKIAGIDPSEKGAADFNTRHKKRNGEILELDASLVQLQMGDKTYVGGFLRDITAIQRS